jgi:hypothetical protein
MPFQKLEVYVVAKAKNKVYLDLCCYTSNAMSTIAQEIKRRHEANSHDTSPAGK